MSSLPQTTCGPQRSSPILSPRPWAERGRPGPISPQLNQDLTFQCPQHCSARAKGLDPRFSSSKATLEPFGDCAHPTPPQAWANPREMGRWQAGAAWAGFTAWPARLLVLRWASCRICPIIWTVEFNSHCVLTRSPANITGRHPLHASRPLPSHTAHPYSKLKI